jgi:hypothetical protein
MVIVEELKINVSSFDSTAKAKNLAQGRKVIFCAKPF